MAKNDYRPWRIRRTQQRIALERARVLLYLEEHKDTDVITMSKALKLRYGNVMEHVGHFMREGIITWSRR